MKMIRSLLLSSMAMGMSATAVCAADYYVSAARPGPVAGTPLAAISLQAKTKKLSPVRTETRLQTNVNQRGNTAGKWVRVGQTPTTTTTTTAASTTTTTATPAAQSTSATSAPLITPLAAPAAGVTFASFGALVQSGKLTGGDRVFLMDGYHGALTIKDLDFSTPITIAQMPGQTAQVEMIGITNSSNIILRDFKVWAMSANAGTGPLIRTYSSSSDITLTNLDVRSVADAGNYATWSKATWLANKRTGMLLQGTRISAIGNRVTGLYYGIQADGTHASIASNIVDGFSGDAMRALGDDSVVRGNKVQNCYQIDANHADGFQSFSRGPTGTPGAGTVHNLVIENNKFFEWTLSAPNALRCKLQGIGMFDGMFDNTLIRNNVVAVSGYHGIAVSGALNTVITHNTVINPTGAATTYPWIKVNKHKNGTPIKNVTVANNTVNAMQTWSKAASNVVVANNIIVKSAASEFTSVAKLDFSLLATAKSANAGATAYTVPLDILGAARPKGTGPDAGAYESR